MENKVELLHVLYANSILRKVCTKITSLQTYFVKRELEFGES